MKSMDIKGLKRKKIKKEKNGVNFRLAELEILDGQAKTSPWHWR